MIKRQQLPPGDRGRRLACCQLWLLAHPERFLEDLQKGDEAGFAMNLRVNTHNIRTYLPRRYEPLDFAYKVNNRGKVIVWARLMGNGSVIVPFFFQNNLNGEEYVRMIDNDVVPVIEQMPRYISSWQEWTIPSCLVGTGWCPTTQENRHGAPDRTVWRTCDRFELPCRMATKVTRPDYTRLLILGTPQVEGLRHPTSESARASGEDCDDRGGHPQAGHGADSACRQQHAEKDVEDTKRIEHEKTP